MTKKPKRVGPLKIKLSDPMTAEQFRDVRIMTGLTQAQFAAVLGYGHANRVSAIEIESKNITPLLERLVRAYAAGYRPADWPAPATAEEAA